MVKEAEEYLFKALADYAGMSDSDKKIVRAILKRTLFEYMDYDFRDFDAIFQEA